MLKYLLFLLISVSFISHDLFAKNQNNHHRLKKGKIEQEKKHIENNEIEINKENEEQIKKEKLS